VLSHPLGLSVVLAFPANWGRLYAEARARKMDELAVRTAEARGDATPVLDLRPVLWALRSSKWWVACGAIVGLGLGGIVWNIRGVTYEAVATLAVIQPRAQTQPSADTTSNYRALLENYSVATSVIKDQRLGDGPRPIDPGKFLREVLSVEEIRGTNLVRIHVRLNSPTKAAAVAEDVATRAVDLSRRVNEDEGATLRDRLKSQQDEALANFKVAEQRLITFKRVNHLDELEAEVKSLVQQREKLLGVDVDLSAQRGRAEATEREKAARPAVTTYSRTFEDSPALTEAARTQTGGDSRALLGLGLRTEVPNPIHEDLDRELAMARAKIAELERHRRQILDSIAQFDKAGKLADWYDKQTQALGLEADRLLARKVYDDVAMRYEQAKVVVTSGSAQLQIVDAAYALPNPMSWPLPVSLILGALLGMAMAAALAVAAALARQLARSIGARPV
jgi:uncharacterized protein involved in exopolysaccharide biosynthesis